MNPAVLAFGDQPGPSEHLEMLRDGRQGHGVRGGEIADARLALGKPGEHGAPRRVGERREGVIQNR